MQTTSSAEAAKLIPEYSHVQTFNIPLDFSPAFLEHQVLNKAVVTPAGAVPAKAKVMSTQLIELQKWASAGCVLCYEMRKALSPRPFLRAILWTIQLELKGKFT